jgi:hypothetical protein
MAVALVYDPRFHTWDSWASLMCELYASQQLEIPSVEENWQQWAAGFKGIDLLANEAVPDPYAYGLWYDWAEAVVNAVNPTVGA